MSFLEIIRWLEEKWHSDFAPYFLFVGGTLLALSFHKEFPVITVESWKWVLGSVFFGLLIVSCWFYQHRIPKNPKDHLGFAIAITSEDGDPRSIIARDFIMSLRELLQQIQDPQTSFHVIELSKYHASKITTDLEAAAYCKKSRSHFLVYGASKIRKLKGKDFHYIKLKGLVVHSPLTFQNQVVLSNEMKDVLPSDIKVSCENDLVEFEIASLCFSESAKFVIATAAMLSSDFDLAFHLLSQLEASRNALEKHKKNTPAVAHLLKIIPQRLADVSGILSEIEFNSWRMGRQHEHLKLAKKYRDKSNQLRPGDIRYFLINAIWYFVTNRDVRSAIKELNKCRAKYIQIPVWRYSSAFLHAYAGDMKNAEKEYEAAFLLDSSYEIGFEVEEFIDWVLSIEPAKFQLRYCLGLINLKIKDDIDSAASEFNKFIASDTQNLFSETKEKALTYLEEINMQLLNIRSHTHT